MQHHPISNGAAHGKSPFVSPQIRKLTENEMAFAAIAEAVLSKDLQQGVIAIIPAFVSYDHKARELIFGGTVADKIQKGGNAHGKISIENLIINANDWDYVIRGIKGDPDRMNLIKSIPGAANFLIIGAKRKNGYYITTHFEVLSKNGKRLKNLLLRGDSLDRSGRTP